ncbi:MAG: helicase-related protein [Chloroflexota bacterium]
MPRIFDNISEHLLKALTITLENAYRADFCVGYFNLRGWRDLQPYVERWPGGEDHCCRLMIGMQGRPEDELRQLYSLSKDGDEIDAGQVKRLTRQAAETFRQQLMFGAPTNADESGLRNLAHQLREGKLVVKLYLRRTLHAKLYLLYREDFHSPIISYLGSSNLTFSGLQHQGELNIEETDPDTGQKLAIWFQDRWDDKWCIDVSEELVKVIEESWAREDMLSPYAVYLKMAYHLAQEARAGLSEFRLPREFSERLFDYQAAAVKIAAHHLNKRGGVMLGDVVGLGKTLMAITLARIFQDDYSLDTLIICPKNLVPMWQDHADEFRLLAKVMSLSMVTRDLPNLRRYRLIVIDESHNLRNREGRTYRAIQDYITANESKCILLSATPYNKSFSDLSAQLGLFIDEKRDLGIRPERYLREIGGEAAFAAKHQVTVRSLQAFEKSEFIEDWRELMRLYLVRRTRSFILDNYTETDQDTGRRFLRLKSGERSYFPMRVPKTVQFSVNESDQYRLLYSEEVVGLINSLSLPRYGLGQYVAAKQAKTATAEEKKLIENLGRAGQRLMGFCRTNLFKRLESSGSSFLQSIDRHVLRNCIFLYAVENGLDLPIGTLDAVTLDPETEDEDEQALLPELDLEIEDSRDVEKALDLETSSTHAEYAQRAKQVYALFAGKYKKRYKWLKPSFFSPALRKDLADDNAHLIQVLEHCGEWSSERDSKLQALMDLLNWHSDQKVLVFSQFADTVRYLDGELSKRGIQRLGAATGQLDNPTALAWRFSPVSNRRTLPLDDELNVLISTDVLSEGQNLQDSAIVVNYDLPWAIIRLVQRAGRVDRIGQRAEQIYCYSFLPADGVEQIIRLRARVRQRLAENGEVVGSDERFFEDDALAQQLRDLYTEKSGVLDAEADSEVDLASYAYQIWLNATKDNQPLAKAIEDLPDVIYSTRHYQGSVQYPEGVLVYMKTADGTDSLAWVDQQGNNVTQSQLTILRAAACEPDTEPQPRHPDHHELVLKGVDILVQEELTVGGQLGRPSSARYRTYERLKKHYEYLIKTQPLLVPKDLERTIDDIYRYPLRSSAVDTLNRQIRSGISDDDLAELVIALRTDERLSLIQEEGERHEPHILCSLGLFASPTGAEE